MGAGDVHLAQAHEPHGLAAGAVVQPTGDQALRSRGAAIKAQLRQQQQEPRVGGGRVWKTGYDNWRARELA